MPAGESCTGMLAGGALLVGLAIGPVSLLALLTVPACLAVRRLMARRFAAPLQRGRLERSLVLCAALAGACGAVLSADGFDRVLSGSIGGFIAQGLLIVIVPAPLGTIPWAAGELLAGESETPGLALVCSIGHTYVLSLSGLWLQGAGAFTAPTVAGQLAATGFAALGGAATYLAMRGKAIAPAPPEAVALLRVLSDYSSSMRENRSLPGCSSGF